MWLITLKKQALHILQRHRQSIFLNYTEISVIFGIYTAINLHVCPINPVHIIQNQYTRFSEKTECGRFWSSDMLCFAVRLQDPDILKNCLDCSKTTAPCCSKTLQTQHSVTCQKIKILYISAVETDLTHNRILLYSTLPHIMGSLI